MSETSIMDTELSVKGYGAIPLSDDDDDGSEYDDDNFLCATESGRPVDDKRRYLDSTRTAQTEDTSSTALADDDSQWFYGSSRKRNHKDIVVSVEDEIDGTATIASEVVNIMQNLIGSGIFSMSNGIAQYGNDPKSGITITSSLWIVLFGAIFGYFSVIIAKICTFSGSRSYSGCWESTMGSRGRLAVGTVNTVLPSLSTLGFGIVLGETLQPILAYLHIFWSRTSCMLLIAVVLLPLCLMRKLDALTPFSCLGIISKIVFASLMILRYVDGSYRPGGQYYGDNEPALQPHFGETYQPWSLSVIPYVCMIFQGWVMHFNCPRFYNELKDRSILRFSIAIAISFGLTAAFYIIVTLVGFLTFGDHSSCFILNNYSPNDPLATACRVALFVSSLLAYPIGFMATRDGCLDVTQQKIPSCGGGSDSSFRLATVLLLATLTLIACLVDDLGLVNVIGGGLFSTLICFAFPALMFRQAIMNDAPLSVSLSKGQQREVLFVQLLSVVGVLVGGVGVWEALSTAK